MSQLENFIALETAQNADRRRRGFMRPMLLLHLAFEICDLSKPLCSPLRLHGYTILHNFLTVADLLKSSQHSQQMMVPANSTHPFAR